MFEEYFLNCDEEELDYVEEDEEDEDVEKEPVAIIDYEHLD